MWKQLSAAPGCGKWCAYVALALMPGSFVVLPVLWGAQKIRQVLAARYAAPQPASAARA